MSGRITIPVEPGCSGVATKAAKRLPSVASRIRSSCETAAPEIFGTGGSESRSKHTSGTLVGSAGRAPAHERVEHVVEVAERVFDFAAGGFAELGALGRLARGAVRRRDLGLRTGPRDGFVEGVATR